MNNAHDDVKQSILALSKVIEDIGKGIGSDSDLGYIVEKLANISEMYIDEIFYMVARKENLECIPFIKQRLTVREK